MPRHDELHLYRSAIDPAARRFGVLNTPRTSVHPSQTSRSWRVRVDYIQPTTTSSYSSVTRHCRQQGLTKPNSVGRAARLRSDEPVCIYVPLLMRPWIMQACHSMASCHLGTTRTLRMLERFIWWIGMNVCTRWWLRHCLKCQARKNLRLTVRWPIISMPLPEGPGVAVAVDYFGPFRSHHEATPTSCCSPIASVVGPTCSPSQPLSSPRRVQPISW